MKAVVMFPIILENFLRRMILPRPLFIASYAPQSEMTRQAEEQLRNGLRKADYYTKKAMWGVK